MARGCASRCAHGASLRRAQHRRLATSGRPRRGSWPSTAWHRGCAYSFPGPPLHYVNWPAPWTSSPSASTSTCTFALGTGRPSEQLQQSWKQCSRPHYSSCLPLQCAPPRSAARDFGQTTQWAPLGTSSRCPKPTAVPARPRPARAALPRCATGAIGATPPVITTRSFELFGEHRGVSGPPPRVRPRLQASRTLQSREGRGRARSRSPARTRNAGTTPSSSGLRPKCPPLGGRGSSRHTFAASSAHSISVCPNSYSSGYSEGLGQAEASQPYPGISPSLAALEPSFQLAQTRRSSRKSPAFFLSHVAFATPGLADRILKELLRAASQDQHGRAKLASRGYPQNLTGQEVSDTGAASARSRLLNQPSLFVPSCGARPA